MSDWASPLKKRWTLTALLLAGLAVAGCGIKGPLEQGAPLFGTPDPTMARTAPELADVGGPQNDLILGESAVLTEPSLLNDESVDNESPDVEPNAPAADDS